MNIQEQSAAAQEEQSPEWKSMTAPQVKSEPDIQMPMEKASPEPSVPVLYDIPLSPATGSVEGQAIRATPPQVPQAGFPGGMPPYGSGPGPAGRWNTGYPVAPQRHKRRGLWVVIGLLVLVTLLIAGGIGLVVGSVIATSSIQTRHFTVGAAPHIVVRQTVGSIHVNSAGTSDEVSVQTTKWMSGMWSDPNAFRVSYAQSEDGNTVTVTVEGPTLSSIFNGPGVALDLTVPSTSDLNLTMNAGDISVTGVSGQLVLLNNTGSITVREATLGAGSSLTTKTGSIVFRGSIERQGNYLFSANTGSIDVTVPSNAAFHLDASTDTGSISGDLPGVAITHNTVTGSQAHGDVGSAPSASMILRSNTGSIHLTRGT